MQRPTLLPVVPLLLLLLLLPRVSSHGLVCDPRPRAAYHSELCPGSDVTPPPGNRVDYCAHCLNGGTKATVMENMPPGGWAVYDPIADFEGSAQRAGLCGDPAGGDDHMMGGSMMPYDEVPMVRTYKTGSVVDFTVELDTNHNGYFEFFLCDLDKCGAKDIEKECFMEGHCHRLLRVEHPDCENPSEATHYECGPVDPAYPGRWYVPCRMGGHVGQHIVGGDKGTMRYQLPQGVKCKHCVIQWYWATANGCAPRGFLDYFEAFDNPFGTECDGDGGAKGGYRAGMEECGGDVVPEEFWNCSDVQITDDGESAGKVSMIGDGDGEDGAGAGEGEGEVEDEDDGEETEPAPESPSPSASPVEVPVETPSPSSSAAPVSEPTVVTPPPSVSPVEQAAESTPTPWGNAQPGPDGDTSSSDGKCVQNDAPCDGSMDCCDMNYLCVYTDEVSGFTCRDWRELWQDVQTKEGIMYD